MNKKIILGLFLAGLINFSGGSVIADDEVWQVVKLDDGMTVDSFLSAVGLTNDQIQIGTHGWLKISGNLALTMDSGSVIKIENDAMAEIQATVPDDYFYESDQWNLEKVGMEYVWDDYRGSDRVVVAVLDTGLNTGHEDMSGFVWINEDETSNNNKDDDNNGYIDDVFGYNLIKESPNVMDDNGHGTAVASIIAANTDNETGIAGINWQATIMPVKVASSSGTASLYDIAQGIYYAVDNGADIINMSLGSSTDRDFLEEAVQYAAENGVLMVAASGNSSSSSAIIKYPLYPSAYDEVMAIGATTVDDEVANLNNSSFVSHYGNNLDMVAPGVEIITADGENDDGYVVYDGTSMATPHVAGVAALMLSKNPDLTAEQMRSILLDTAYHPEPMSGNFDEKYGYGRLDAKEAMEAVSLDGDDDDDEDIPDDPVIVKDFNAVKTMQSNDWYLRPGETREIRVKYKNISSVTWPVRSDKSVRLGTDGQKDRMSVFYDSVSWLTANRITSYNIDDVDFGEEIEFKFNVIAPVSEGVYNECFSLVWDGYSWFENTQVCFDLHVTSSNVYSAVWNDQSDYLDLKLGEMGESWIEFVNNGTATWDKEGFYPVHLGTDRPMDRYSIFHDENTWLADNRIELDQSTVQPGEAGRFSFEVMARNKGVYSEYFRPVVEGKEWLPDYGVFLQYSVK